MHHRVLKQEDLHRVMALAMPSLTQYDLSATTYSPDGKVFQTEYAQKAVDSGRWVHANTCRSVACKGLQQLCFRAACLDIKCTIEQAQTFVEGTCLNTQAT